MITQDDLEWVLSTASGELRHRYLYQNQCRELDCPQIHIKRREDKTMTISNDAVAKLFASGATEGESKNMYIREETIYSYGPHFPIARRIPGGYVFNSNSSSMTTARHKSDVLHYIHKDILWELPDCHIQTALETYARRALRFMKAIPTSRQRFSFYLELLEHNFDKAIEASEKLGQDIQPLYSILDSNIAAAAIKRIKKEGSVPKVMLAVFGKAKFLAQDTRANVVHI